MVEVVDGLDLRAMSGSYRGSGSASYHPRMLLGILVYGYATGVSFRAAKLERATYDSVAFRFIAANDHPDHDTIATFRRRFPRGDRGSVRSSAAAAGAGDGRSEDGDGGAGRHEDLTPTPAGTARCRMNTPGKIEAQLKKPRSPILMAKAEAADAADIPDGMSRPDDLGRREERLGKLAGGAGEDRGASQGTPCARTRRSTRPSSRRGRRSG